MTRPRSLASQSIHGIVWTVLLQGGEAVMQAIAMIVLARLVSPQEFGLVGAALVVVSFSQVFSQFGIGPALVQRQELTDRHIITAFWGSVILGLICAASIILAAPLIARFFRMPALVPVLRVTSTLFIVSGLSIVAQSLIQRNLRFRELALSGLASTILGYGGVGILMAWHGFGAWSLVFANLAQRATKTVWLLRLARHPIGFGFHGQAFRDLVYFGGGQTLAQVGNLIAREGDNIVVGRWLGVDALGLYGRAYQLMVTPTSLIAQALNIVLFPAMAQIQTSKERLAAIYRRGLVGIHCVTFPASVLLIVLAPEIISVLLGPQWMGAVTPFQILSAGLAFRTSTVLSESLIRATGEVYRGAWRQWVFAGAVIGGSVIGTRWGISGVAAGVLVAMILKFVLLLHLSLRITETRLRLFLRLHELPIAMSALVFLEIYAVANWLRPSGSTITTLLVTVILWSLTFAGVLVLGRKFLTNSESFWLFDRLRSEFLNRRTAV